MQISVFGHETIITDDLNKYAEEKINKLSKYNNNIIGVEITLEENHHQKNKSKAFIARGLVKIPGNDIKAEASSKTLYSAVDFLEQKLGSQLLKEKGKTKNKSRFSKGKTFIHNLLRRQ